MNTRKLLRSLRHFYKSKRNVKTLANSGDLSDNAVKLSYRNYHQADLHVKYHKSPVIIMHGLMGSKANWHSLSRVIMRTGRKVITVDARNHGDSPHREEMDYSLMAGDVMHLMDILGEERATLIGHSMGGKVFMTAAMEHPERVDRLVVVDVLPRPSPRAGELPVFLQTMLKVQSRLCDTTQGETTLAEAKQIADEILKECEPNVAIRQFLIMNLIQTQGRIKWRVNLDSLINNYSDLSGYPDFEGQQYKGPTLFIGGETSNYIRSDDLPFIEKFFPNVDLKFVEGAGHWVHSDKPSAFLSILNKFLHDTDKNIDKR